MVAHQYNGVGRDAWLLQLKMLMSFLPVFLLLGVWYKKMYYRALHCKTKQKVELFGVWCDTGGLLVPRDPFRCVGLFQSHILRERESLTNRSPYPN